MRTWNEVGESAKQKFEELSHKGWDWRSFYNGFIEGALSERSLGDNGSGKLSDTMRQTLATENGEGTHDNRSIESNLPRLSVEDQIRLYRASGGSLDGEKKLRSALEATELGRLTSQQAGSPQ